MKNNYFNLIRELAVTDFKLKYNGSVLGYVWSLVKPFAIFLVLYFVFTRIFKIGDSVPYYPVYLLLGITLWGFFAETTTMCMHSIIGRGDLIRKIYFPRIVLPISSSISALITLVLNMIVVFGFALYMKIPFNFELLLFLPLVVLEFYVLSLGVAFFLASLIVRFRDIGHIWEVLSQILFYATPIIYPLVLIPDRFIGMIMLNPVAQIIQDFRKIFISPDIKSSFDILGLYGMFPYLLTVLVFIIGYVVFNKMSARFAEEI